MFCRNCGKPVRDDQELCSSCTEKLNALSHKDAPARAGGSEHRRYSSERSVPASDTFVLNTVDSALPKRSTKKRGGLIAAIIALAVVAAVAVGVVFNLDRVKAFAERTFQSPEEYLANVEGEAIAEFSTQLTQSYGKVLDSYGEDLTASEAEICLNLGDNILSLVQTAFQQQGIYGEADWLREIRLSVNTNVQEDAMQMGMGVGLGNNDVLSADVIVDMEDGNAYFALPELNKAYLYTDISYDISADELSDMLSQSRQMYSDLIQTLPSEAELNELINSYVGIILSGIKYVDMQKTEVTVSGVSQKMVVLNAKVREADLIDICTAVLKRAEKDRSLEKIFLAINDYINEMNVQLGYYAFGDLYQEFISAVPYLLEELEGMKEYADNSNYLDLKIYVDMEGRVRGHELAVYTEGEMDLEPFSWMTVVKGDTTYVEGEIDTVEISGQKVEKKGVSSGFYALAAEGVDIGMLEFSNVTENGGTLRLTPGEDILYELLYNSGISAAIMGEDLALELSYSSMSAHDIAYELNILTDAKTLIDLAISLKVSSGGKISIPSNALSADSEESAMEWIQGMDFENVLNALEKADVPQALLDVARSYLSSLGYYY